MQERVSGKVTNPSILSSEEPRAELDGLLLQEMQKRAHRRLDPGRFYTAQHLHTRGEAAEQQQQQISFSFFPQMNLDEETNGVGH